SSVTERSASRARAWVTSGAASASTSYETVPSRSPHRESLLSGVPRPARAPRRGDRRWRDRGAEGGGVARCRRARDRHQPERVPDARIRTRLWYRIVDSDAIESVRRGDVAGARRRIEQLVQAAAGRRNGRPARPTRGAGIVSIVGAGPGDPGLITRRGLERLRAAEVVVYDRLVHPDLLEEAPPWAER